MNNELLKKLQKSQTKIKKNQTSSKIEYEKDRINYLSKDEVKPSKQKQILEYTQKRTLQGALV